MSVNEELRGYRFGQLEEGMSAVFSKTITEADLMVFSGVSGDTNPVHLDAEFAGATMFKQRIAHGMLVGSLISTVVGTKLPGHGAIYVNQNLKFRAPVHIGDTVVARATITKLIPDRKFVEMETTCMVGERVVIAGTATLMVPE